MKKSILALLAATLCTLGATAQTIIFGGEVVSPANMSHMEAAKYGNTEHTFLSSRVAAMGGAFTSLGADISSMAINPAGLGMFRTSALSVSVAFDRTRSNSDTQAGTASKSNFGFNQLGTVLNLYQSSGSLVSVSVGFGYNQLADLSFRNSGRWDNGEVTIGEFFAEQMYGIDPTALNSSADPFRNNNIYVDEWGGILAYQTYLIDPALGEDKKFLGNYIVSGVPLENRVDSRLNVESDGSVGEYDFSMGFNFGNILYLGTTLTVQDIVQNIFYNFEESYDGASGAEELTYTGYTPIVSTYGSGVNFKIGAIVRPIAPLRLGIAFHTPTAMSITRDYSATMETHFANGDGYVKNSLLSSYGYTYTSPAKLLLGVSYALSNKALISVDYDRVWYGGMRMRTRGLEELFEQDVETDLGTASNFRAGVEVRPFSSLYLRGGYAYYGSPLNSAATKYNDDGNPFYGTYKTHSTHYSFGAGWRFASGSSLDVVCTLSSAHYTNSVMYYYSYTDASTNINVSGPTMNNTKHSSTTIGVTYNVLF
ncbi:MAG: hypothetical protein J6V28_02250 [Tidjanibacter sp.]|nr:hypothetical protein [Tidjanibacter sp.]